MTRRTPPIRFESNEEKATAAAAVLLKLAGGKMNYLKLIKLLYLAERESLRRFARPIIGDDYFSMPKGPVLSIVLNLIKAKEDEAQEDLWLRYVHRNNHDVELIGDPGNAALSDAEIEILGQVFEKHKTVDPFRLVQVLHKELPEWKDPGKSRIKIHPEDILRAVGTSEEDIEEIAREIAGLNTMDALLGDHASP
jgi:uncharacterized phage-associated protein